MPASAKIALPRGRIGATFKGTPPQLVKLVDNSPLHGKMMVPGSFVEGLTMACGSHMTGLSTPALLSILQSSAGQDGRFLYLKADVADLSSPGGCVVLPSGPLKIVFKGTPPVVYKIQDESPLLGRMAEGVMVDCLELPDGSSFAGLSTSELLKILKATTDQVGRKLTLVGDEDEISPSRRKIILPTGKLGLSFKFTPPVVWKVQEDSPIKDFIKADMFVEALVLDDGTELGGLDTADLMMGLKEHGDQENRTLILRDVATELSGDRIVKLPSGKLYITFKGMSPPFVVDVNVESPLYGQVKEGCYVDKLVLGDGTEFTGLDRVELLKIINDTIDLDGRTLYIKDKHSLPSPAGRKIVLPAGKIGITFKGDAPRVKRVTADSPIVNKIKEGLHVQKLTFGSGEELGAPSFDELMDGFMDSKDEEGRILHLSENPNTGTRNVTLPKGTIGVIFKGTPPFTTQIKSDSPMWSRISQGFTVEKFSLSDGTEYEGMHSGELLKLLSDHADEEGRVLHLREARNRVLPKAGSSRRMLVQPPESNGPEPEKEETAPVAARGGESDQTATVESGKEELPPVAAAEDGEAELTAGEEEKKEITDGYAQTTSVEVKEEPPASTADEVEFKDEPIPVAAANGESAFVEEKEVPAQ